MVIKRIVYIRLPKLDKDIKEMIMVMLKIKFIEF